MFLLEMNRRLGVFNRVDNSSYYQLAYHLGNVRAVTDRASNGTAMAIVAATDYYPGMPMPGRNVEGNYRYKFQGQEKDPETGMEAFEARLWDARIGRWLTVDPAREFFSPYLGMGNNPISVVDPDGRCTDCPKNAKKGDTFNHPEFGKVTFVEGGGWTDASGNSILNDVTLNFSKSIGEFVPDKINFSTMNNNQIISLAVDWYALIEQVSTKKNGELFNVTDFVEPEFRKSRNPFGSMTVDGPEVIGKYNGKDVRFTVIDKSIIREKSYKGSISYFRPEPLEMKGFRSQL